MKNDMLKSIIMEQIDTAEIFYGYKIDDKNAFCVSVSGLFLNNSKYAS